MNVSQQLITAHIDAARANGYEVMINLLCVQVIRPTLDIQSHSLPLAGIADDL